MNSWALQKARDAFDSAGVDVSQVSAATLSNMLKESEPPTVALSDLATPGFFQDWSGNKFPGGFGETKLYDMDYWALRKRSGQMFVENMYARGIIRRLVTNEINTGLSLECTPEELILGYAEDELGDWAEDIENRFALWSKTPKLCDHRELLTFGGLQRAIRMESLISGDVLQVIRMDEATGMPRIQLVSGELIQTPMEEITNPLVKHGVKLDQEGRHVGFYVTQEDGTSKYLPAFGEKTGRKIAWLVYGTQNRMDSVRGEPILSVILQSLKELDRYKDSAQRKATINSMLAMFIKKTADKAGTLPITGSAVRRDAIASSEIAAPRKFNMAGLIPGLVIEELQTGEEPVPGSTAGTDVNLGPFEAIVVNGMSWCLEIPPEILQLSFSNNYSASQAAINEFKIYLNRQRTDFGEISCQPVFTEVLLSMALTGKIKAPEFLKAWRTPKDYDKFAAWLCSDWSGAIKPSTDIKKQAAGYKDLVGEGWITNDRAARELTGTKFSKNIKRLARENQLKVNAATPFAEFRKKYGDEIAKQALLQVDSNNGALADAIADALADRMLDNSDAQA